MRVRIVSFDITLLTVFLCPLLALTLGEAFNQELHVFIFNRADASENILFQLLKEEGRPPLYLLRSP